MHTTNYYNTFIHVSEDCPTDKAKIPELHNNKKTIAVIQYEMISKNPYQYTSDDILFTIFTEKQQINLTNMTAERELFFNKGQACLRSSPLVKQYGWGIHYDIDGKIAIYARESLEYKQYAENKNIKQLKGMKSKK